MSSILEEKRKLQKEWGKLKDLGNNDDLTFDQFFKIRKIEEESYKKWKFYDNFTKAEEKIKNENTKKL